MDDPDYAAKYSKPYGRDKPLRMVKQAIDARHLNGKVGTTVGVGGAGDPASISGEIGGFAYTSECTELNAGLTAVAGTGALSAFVGPEVRYRLVAPARLSPFVGVGAFAGVNWFDEPAENDGIDNDDDLFVDEPGEEKENYEAFLAVYPEIGVHFWANGRWRLTGSGRYYVNTEGRDSDFWHFGLSLGWVSREEGEDDQIITLVLPEGSVEVDALDARHKPETALPPSFLDDYHAPK